MNERVYKRAAESVPAALTSVGLGAPEANPAPYVPGFVDRQLDRLIALCDRVMPDLPSLGLFLSLAVVIAYECGANFSSDDFIYPMPMDGSSITEALSAPEAPPASGVQGTPSPPGEVQDTRALARVR